MFYSVTKVFFFMGYIIKAYLLRLLIFTSTLAATADIQGTANFGDYVEERAALLALGDLTTAPATFAPNTSADNYQATNTPVTINPSATQQTLQSIFFDSVEFRGDRTRVFAHVGMPAWNPATDDPLPGIVLVHGGGGRAFTEWAELWAERGYFAIAIDTEGASTTTARHNQGGPRRNGVFNEANVVLEDQFMYHATAGTILANSLMRSLPFVDEDKVGVHGVSWGGAITATAIGIDDRFAFAIPSYGCGHSWDAVGNWQEAISDAGGIEYYRNLWDPMLRLENATMPIMWLSWPRESTFNIDTQANSYNQAPGTKMVSLVPGMRHSHVFTWRRADSYDFADSIVGNNNGSTGVSAGEPWCIVTGSERSGNQVTAEFESTRPLTGARLFYTDEMGSTELMEWPDIAVNSFVETSSGNWRVRATLPANTNGWFVNVTAETSISDTSFLSGRTSYISDTIYVSSGLREIVDIEEPDLVEFELSGTQTTSTESASVDFTAINNLEIIAVEFVNESHPGAFSTNEEFTFGLLTGEEFDITFSNTVAGLLAGETSTATLQLTWRALDNVTTETIAIPLEARVSIGSTTNNGSTNFLWNGEGSNGRWNVGDNWIGDQSPPNTVSESFTNVIISDVGGRTTANTFQDYTISSLTFNGAIDDSFTLNVFRAAAFVRNLTFDRGGDNVGINVISGASGDILISALGTTGSVILNDHLDLTHQGSGTLTFDIPITEESGDTQGITSSGSGLVVLQGENTYTGDTIIQAGEMTMEDGSSLAFIPTTNGVNNKLSGSGSVNLEGEININLDTTDSTLGNSWVLIDASNLNVTYDSSSFNVNSSQGNFTSSSEGIWEMNDGTNRWVFNQSTGILSVVEEEEDEYAAWIGTSFERPFTNTDPEVDFDNDGLSNLLEFVLGGDPTISQQGVAPSSVVSDSSLQIIFQRSDESRQSSAIELVIEVSDDLTFTTPENDIVIGDTGNLGPIGALGSSYTVDDNDEGDAITVSIPMGETRKRFARLKVTQQ